MENNKTFRLNNIEVQPGQRWCGYLELGGGKFRLPAAVLHGEQPGRTMLITAGVHSGEYVVNPGGHRAFSEIKIEKVTGTVIIVK